MRAPPKIFFPIFLSVAGCAHRAPRVSDPSGASSWPVPPGWRAEAMTFPLEFAPDIPLRGTEQIRFMPHFFDPGAPTYWSYDFAWLVDDAAPVDQAELARDLERYFRGLTMAVGGAKYSFDASRFHVTLAVDRDGSFRGTALLYDPFTTGLPLTLSLAARTASCAGSSRRTKAIVVLASPRAPTDPIWAELTRAADAFACS